MGQDRRRKVRGRCDKAKSSCDDIATDRERKRELDRQLESERGRERQIESERGRERDRETDRD